MLCCWASNTLSTVFKQPRPLPSKCKHSKQQMGRKDFVSSSLPNPESAPRSPVVPCRKHVLLVDDNAFVRQALSEIFRKEADFDVCGEAENGYEAARSTKSSIVAPRFNCVGLAMPVMNGLESARVLKRLMPAIPLIMYSGFEDKFVEQQAQFIGIAALIPKPEPPGGSKVVSDNQTQPWCGT